MVKEQLDVKLVRSMGRLKTIKERRKDWEVINGEGNGMGGGEVQVVGAGRFGVLDGWVDEDAGEEEREQNEGNGVRH